MGKAEGLVKSKVYELLIECQGYLNFWNNATGKAQYENKDGSTRWVKYGQEGSADTFAIASPNGRFIGIELKSAKGEQREKQIKWQKMVERRGGLYILATGENALKSVLETLFAESIIPQNLYRVLKDKYSL